MSAGTIQLDDVAARCGDPSVADDLKYVIKTASEISGGKYKIEYTPNLVRGQGYYTGMVFEITCPQFSGAVAGGGRYDNMVGKFLGQQVPAVGFSIGFERICGILMEQGYKVPDDKERFALLYDDSLAFPAVVAKANELRGEYCVALFKKSKKIGPQLNMLESAGFTKFAALNADGSLKMFGGDK